MTGKIPIGVDVSKAWLDMAVDGHVQRIANDPAVIGAVLDGFDPDTVACVAFEATGGHERHLVQAATARGLPLRRVHPNALVAFRTVHRVTAKTDAIDARLIARYAGTVPADHPFQPSPDPRLHDLVARRRQLVEMRHAERCRRDGASCDLAASHDTVIACLTDQIAGIERAIAARLDEDGPQAPVVAVLTAVKGVGSLTTATLLADLPELGYRSGKTIAALVGLAPRTRISGTLAARASIGHGRAGVRQVLFNATRAAIRSNPVIHAFFDQLKARGKPGRVAFTAAMRKLLVILNAKARDARAAAA